MQPRYRSRYWTWPGMCLAATLPFAAQAESDGITARIGTLGYGVEFAHGLSPGTQLRIGANGGSYNFSGSEGNVDYNGSLKLRSGDVLLDFFPFNHVLFFSVGALYDKNKIELKSKNGTYTINGGSYTNPNVTGDVTFKTFAPYLGLGLGASPTSKGFAWIIDVGVAYQGSPKVTLQSSSVSSANLDPEAAKAEDALHKYKYYPHIGLSFGARF